MSLAPLWQASPAIQLHALAAMAAFAIAALHLLSRRIMHAVVFGR
jgi:uncharacterized membrane protein